MRIRAEVRAFLTDPAHADALSSGAIAVAVSGGADSLALTDGTVHACAKLGVQVHALVVDHQLQEGSAQVAADAAEVAERLGAHSARVLPVRVEGTGGPEAAARRARYDALREAVPAQGSLVLLGHTLDDQAETVLLGLGRGSGPRSVAGMRPLDPPWGRPLLGVPRVTTQQACAELGVPPWSDPHNADPRYTRVRLRTEVLPLLEEVLRGGVAAALARTGAQLREDLEALDALGTELYERALVGIEVPELDISVLADAPAALRRRAERLWLLRSGARDLSDAQLRAVDDLVNRWRGQGGVWLPGDLVARRSHGRLQVHHADATRAES